MATINNTDTIFARISQGGRTLASLSISGMDTIRQVIGGVCARVDCPRGLLTIDLRNTTQGWASRHTLYK